MGVKFNETPNVVSTRVGERVTVYETFNTQDGLMWHLMHRETQKWPNGNPYRLLYRTMFGERLVVWLNEIGELIYAQYA